ncbi:hypothetical protein [Neptunicella sp. SCSIO 80796]|uniref:hypothetical protein n=1 Tax=Neptunicella plasticusilytica TaxID=3117012 RepID=UPI003A4D97C6
MPIPLLWLGAGLGSLALGHHIHKEQQRSRYTVGYFPGEDHLMVTPRNGSVVCCGIYGVFEHSGIWFDDQIIELKGNGLIRAISPARFLANRSGERIFVACDAQKQPLLERQCANRAVARIFNYDRYDLFQNNCHRFTWQCVSGQSTKVTQFSDLNDKLSELFSTPVHWQPAEVNF